MGAIKKAFYLSAIKESVAAFGSFPPKAGEQSCRWELQRDRDGGGPWAETHAGAAGVSSQQNMLPLHGHGLPFWRNAPVLTWKTMKVP